MKSIVKKILREELNKIKSERKYLTNDEMITQEKNVAIDLFGIEIGRTYSNVFWLDINDIKINKQLHGNQFKKDEYELALSMIRDGEGLPPILVDYDYTILEGYNRYKAAKIFNVKKIPVIIHLKNS